MTTKRKIGVLGLNMPETVGPTNPRMTYEAITKWRDSLPMADTGAAAKAIFTMLSEMSRSNIEPHDRLKLVEAIRPQVKAMSTTLKRHYIEQHEPLTAQKLKIADLRETLMSSMADNYKLVLNDLINSNFESERDTIATALCRILYYTSMVLVCRYMLYSLGPEGIWQEIYNIYKYANKENLLNVAVADPASLNKGQTNPLSSFTRIILLFATDPYQWRQKDQHSLAKAIDLWAMYPNLVAYNKIAEDKAGVYIIDLERDLPPTPFNFKEDGVTPTCIALDLKKQVQHLREILEKMHNNALQAKIEHPGDPEFIVTIPTIQKLINIWSHKMIRSNSRFPLTAKVDIVFGLTAAHYYLSGRIEFNPTPTHAHIEDAATMKSLASHAAVKELPTIEVQEEAEENETKNETPIVEEIISHTDRAAKIAKELLYKVYEYDVENISPGGMCLSVTDQSFPPFQAGEIVAFKNPMGTTESWSIGSLRWLRRTNSGKFLLGLQLIAPYAQAAGMQVIRNNKPAGHLLRCLVLPAMPDLNTPSTIITPGIPLHANKIMLYLEGAEQGVLAQLSKEIEATGKYYQFQYTSTDNIVIKKKEAVKDQPTEQIQQQAAVNDKKGSEFDSIWEEL